MMLPGEATVMYFIGAEARGRGVATEACREAARFAFEQLGVERLTWEAIVGNHYSKLVALKVGFQIEGITRNGANQRGVRRDQWKASLLPGELREADDDPTGLSRMRTQARFFSTTPQEISTANPHVSLQPLMVRDDLGMTPAVERSQYQKEFEQGEAVSYRVRLADKDMAVVLTLRISRLDDAIAEIQLTGGFDSSHECLYEDSIRSLIDLAFGELHLERVEWIGTPDEAHKLKVLESTGFEFEGLQANRWCLSGSQRGTAQVASMTRAIGLPLAKSGMEIR